MLSVGIGRAVFTEALVQAQGMHKSSARHYARYLTELPLIVKVLVQDGYMPVHGCCFEFWSFWNKLGYSRSN
jgi:hypothetical protein